MIIDYSVVLGVNRGFGNEVCRGVDVQVNISNVESV